MINKIFLALLGVAVLMMVVLTFLALSQLKSIGFPPVQIVQNFAGYESLHWTLLWISAIVLLILGNVILWTNQKEWALWSSFLFFAVFIMVNTWWLTESVANYQKANSLDTGGILSKNGIFGVVLAIVGGVAVFFDQFIVLRLRDKMYQKPVEEAETKPDETEAEKSDEESAQE
jgi:hypothetical protein